MQGAGFHNTGLKSWKLQPVQGLCAACRESSAPLACTTRQAHLGQRLCQGHGVCVPSGTLDKHAIHIGAIRRSQCILALHMVGLHEEEATPFMALHDVAASPQCHTERLRSFNWGRLQGLLCKCQLELCWGGVMRITAQLQPGCTPGNLWSFRLAHLPLASTRSQK